MDIALPGGDHEPPALVGGILLATATSAALIVANSALGPAYRDVLHRSIAGLDVVDWINDGLMALFFLLIGLEIKRELLSGSLSTPTSRILPGTAAIAGMAVPALLYHMLTRSTPGAHVGWAIPAATDIAFALAVLSLLGRRVPPSLRVFLTAVAVIDDLGAIILIGLFYTAQIDFILLAAAAAGLAVLFVFNRLGVRSLIPYLLVGTGVWIAVHGSGVHATLAGVAVALTIPLSRREGETCPVPLLRLEAALTPWIALVVVPVFGFANAGIVLDAHALDQLVTPIPLAIVAALVIGKQAGVFGAVWLLARTGFAPPPARTSWRQVHGAALLCGIGFTMSLFIAGLAFGAGSTDDELAKLGILGGSLLSAVAGYAILRMAR